MADTSNASNLILEQAKRSKESLAEAQSRAQTASAEVKETNTLLRQGVAKIESLSDTMETAIRSIAAGEGISALVKDNAELKTQQLNIAAYNKAGGAEYQQQLMGELQQESKQLEELRARQTDIADDEFTKVPLIDGIINMFRSFQIDQQVDIATRKQAETLATLQAITAGTEAVNKANIITAENTTKETIAQNQRKIASMADLEAAKIERENLHANASAIATLQTANARAISTEVEVYKLYEEVAERELRELQRQTALEELELRKMKAPLEIEQLKVTLARNQNQLQYETNPTTKLALQKKNEELVRQIDDAITVQEDAANAVRDGQSIMGLPITEDSEVIEAWRTSRDPNEVAKYNMLYAVGKTGVKGATPYDAAAAYQFVDPLNQGKNSPSKVLIEATKRKVFEQSKDPTFVAPKTEDASRALFNKAAKEVRDGYHSQINTGDRSNPFHAPPMATLATIQSVANSELYKKVLQPKGFTETDPQLILEAAIDAVKAKVISPNQAAADYALLFRSAIKFNNESYGGIQTTGFAPQSAYNSPINRASTPFEGITGTAKDIATGAFGVIPVVYGYRKFKEEVLKRPVEPSPVRTYTETVDVSDEIKMREVIVKYLSAQQQ